MINDWGGNILSQSYILTKFMFGHNLVIGKGVVFTLELIEKDKVQQLLNNYENKEVYVHLETTNGAYASHFGNKGINVGAYIRNAKLTYTNAVIEGDTGFRVGLNTQLGWVYGEGLTHYELYENEKLLLAGHDDEGRLMVALQISETPFK